MSRVPVNVRYNLIMIGGMYSLIKIKGQYEKNISTALFEEVLNSITVGCMQY